MCHCFLDTELQYQEYTMQRLAPLHSGAHAGPPAKADEDPWATEVPFELMKQLASWLHFTLQQEITNVYLI